MTSSSSDGAYQRTLHVQVSIRAYVRVGFGLYLAPPAILIFEVTREPAVEITF